MNETIQIIQLAFSFLIVPILSYIMRLEKRIVRIETILSMYIRDGDGSERRERK